VRSVLATVIRPTEAVLAVSPEDRPLVDAALGGLIAQFPAIRNVSLQDDPRLARGSCVARMRDPETAGLGGGEVDASLQTQLDRIVAVLLPGETRGDFSH
jgi:flagellar biosynthesis/type III secretory pathway protein FliH